MDINSELSILIGLPIQYLAILTVNFFWLDYKVSKIDLIKLMLFILLPTTLLFILFDALASFYLLFSLIMFFYRKYSDKLFIFHILISFILAITVDHLSSILSLNIFDQVPSEFLFIILKNILFCSMLTVAAYMYKKTLGYFMGKYIFNKNIYTFLILLIFFTLILFYFNISIMKSKSSYESIQANLWIFIVYIFIIIIITASIIYLSIKHYKIKQNEKEQKSFLMYVELLEQVNNNTRKFKHDYINILSSLRHYIEDDDMAGLKLYFYNHILTSQQKDVHNNLILSHLNNLKVSGLKGLLTTKIIHAQEYGIAVHLEITEEILNIQMDIIELNRILGIILDNAIEASKSIETSRIRIAFILLEHSKVIVVVNSIEENDDLKIHEIYREGYSTKGENRGLGLTILKKIVNSNNHVVLNTKIEKTSFIQELEIKE